MPYFSKLSSAFCLWILALFLVSSVQAANYCVDDPADGPPNAADCPVDCAAANGLCSLRDAIEAANADLAPDEILLPEGTFTLSQVGDDDDANASGDLDVLADLTIQGQGMLLSLVQWDSTLAGDDRDRVLDIDPAANGILVVLNGLALQNGVLTQNGMMNAEAGAGIRQNAAATLNLSEVLVQNNLNQVPGESGGGLLLQGPVFIEKSWVADNQSTGGGGGIALLGAQADLEMLESTVSGNQTTSAGIAAGGIFMSFGSNWSIDNSTISGNTAQSSSGGFLNDGTGILSNATLTENNAITGTGGGLRNQAGSLNIRNSLVAQNTAGGGEVDCDGQNALVSEGSNLIGDGSGCAGLSDGVNQDQVGTQVSPLDAGLEALADNGGATPTHYLQAGSPALDAVDPGNCPPPNQDQRGQVRPAGALCDIGAVEVGSSDLAIALSADTAGPVELGTAVTYEFEVSNNGPDSNLNVLVEGVLPTGAAIQSLDPAACSPNATGFTCFFGTLANGDQVTASIVVILNAEGENTLSVEVEGRETDPDEANNSAELTIAVQASPAPPPVISGGGCALHAATSYPAWPGWSPAVGILLALTFGLRRIAASGELP